LFGAQAAHAVFEFGGEILLGDAGADSRYGLFEGARVSQNGAADAVDFRGRLDHAPPFDWAAGRDQRGFGGQVRFERAEGFAAYQRRLVTDAFDAVAGDGGNQIGLQWALGDGDGAGDFLSGLDLVAWIGKQDGLAGQHEQQGVAAGEAGEVTQVGAEGDEQGVKLAAGERGGNGVAAG